MYSIAIHFHHFSLCKWEDFSLCEEREAFCGGVWSSFRAACPANDGFNRERERVPWSVAMSHEAGFFSSQHYEFLISSYVSLHIPLSLSLPLSLPPSLSEGFFWAVTVLTSFEAPVSLMTFNRKSMIGPPVTLHWKPAGNACNGPDQNDY